MQPKKIIIDTDPGQDDAVAILLALASPEDIEVLGITCVAGNVPLDLTSRNARIVCELAGKTDVKVYAGCDRPLGRALVTAEHVHGKSGLDGPDLPEPVMPLADGHAVDFIIEQLRDHAPGMSPWPPDEPCHGLSKSARCGQSGGQDRADGWWLF
jgi:purine nucleosidase